MPIRNHGIKGGQVSPLEDEQMDMMLLGEVKLVWFGESHIYCKAIWEEGRDGVEPIYYIFFSHRF